jgi:hypothetical protein
MASPEFLRFIGDGASFRELSRRRPPAPTSQERRPSQIPGDNHRGRCDAGEGDECCFENRDLMLQNPFSDGLAED